MSVHLFKLQKVVLCFFLFFSFCIQHVERKTAPRDGWTLFLHYKIISTALGLCKQLRAAIVRKHFTGRNDCQMLVNVSDNGLLKRKIIKSLVPHEKYLSHISYQTLGMNSSRGKTKNRCFKRITMLIADADFGDKFDATLTISPLNPRKESH